MNKQKIKTIFMGTPDFGVLSLEALIADQAFEIIAVITQPDKKIGRQQKLTPTPIKICGLKHHLNVLQPIKLRTEANLIKELNPDLIVVVAYGQIISQEILDIPKFGCINVHGSLLPKYRGAACLNAPILNGDTNSGITIMKMDAGIDTGPILDQAKIKLDQTENLESLHDKLSALGGKILVPTIKKYLAGKIKAKQQRSLGASYVKMLKKEDGHIDFHKPAEEIERMIRAFNPWPGTYGFLSNESLNINRIMFKIMASRPKPLNINCYKPGEIFLDNNALAVQCGQNALVVIKLQIEGKKVMEVDEFLRGNNSIIGSVLK